MPTARLKAATRSGPGSLWSTDQRWSEILARMTGSSRRRYPLMKMSPSRILQLRLKSKNDDQKQRYAFAFRYAARSRNERLPALTLQLLLKRQQAAMEKGAADDGVSQLISAIKPAEWEDLLNSMASRGWSREQFDHWIWILAGENGDARVERLVSTDEPKPVFLLLLLLRSDEVFRKAESFKLLLEYTSKNHITPRSTIAITADATWSAKPNLILTVPQFLILLRRLTMHVQRVWPQSVVGVARFVAGYIKGLSQHMSDGQLQSDYRSQCEIFNTALFLFRRPATNHPLVNMEFNWRAQKVLLAMSEAMEKPLIINQTSYRAIRQVLAGLKKSNEEKRVAMRYAKPWPPYRQDFDGLDAKRTPEDDLSRSIRAGKLMTEAGYTSDHYDLALDTLSGMNAGSPTIQTRSLAPKEWKDDKDEWNFYSSWAMSIRATRNPQEAWQAFNRFALKTGAAPNFQVYGEMFYKLQTRHADEDSSVLPGDSRETFPVYDANYSEYELARLSPPTLAELYDHMISQGVKPEGSNLYRLVSNAGSVEEGLRYLVDSGIDPVSVSALALFKEPSHQTLHRIPLMAFNSYIQLLCRLQPDRRARERINTTELFRIRHAYKLVKLRLVPETTEGTTFRPPWCSLLRSLARPYIAIQNGTQVENDIQALVMSIDVIRTAEKTVGLDPDFFIYLCRTIQKAAVSRLDSLAGSQWTSPTGAEQTPLIPSVHLVSNMLGLLFSKLTRPMTSGDPDSLNLPDLVHSINPALLHSYMRALAFVDDKDGMVNLAGWMLANRSYLEEEAERIGQRGQTLIARTLCAFQAFAGPGLTDTQHEDFHSQMERLAEAGGSWRWPTSEEVDAYIQTDRRGGSQKLQQRLLARWWQASPTAFSGREEMEAAQM
ncbi:Uu.00g146290.m01.CDS01 [Anthostomella pinea]|uniref:Uu.00g146290.m01.CDS01 n=1 Tax=Anthostomella pinea TaxID=933095 RepID=A0AAI8YLT9_9PEZI|nr:Uu.00g146290.m01.CDS01 [Anthostomella pinea]